jgi:DDE superfamily endonuclease
VSPPPRDHTDEGHAHVPPCWHDGTERPLHRPTDPEDQQAYDSGKKTCHTLKNRLVIDETCHLCCLSATYAGKANDKSLADLESSTLPYGSCLYQDRGFQGYTRDGMTIFQPQKKPPGGELTPPEKAANRAMSSIRIRSEHAIGGVKRDRMVKDKIRLLKDGIRETIMETCGGLQNFRLQYRPWHYVN